MLTPSQAFDIASQWGSYNQAGDPGACLYSFRSQDGRPVSEDHRAECIRYIDAHLLPTAATDDAAELSSLREFLVSAPLNVEA